MSSIFDSITVPGAGVTPGSAQVPRYTSYGNSGSSSLPTAAPSSTGLVATVEVPEFVRLVTEAGPTVVLHSDATQPPPPPGSRPAAVRTLHRYVFSTAGIIFIAQSSSALTLPDSARLVECAGILYDGKPIA